MKTPPSQKQHRTTCVVLWVSVANAGDYGDARTQCQTFFGNSVPALLGIRSFEIAKGRRRQCRRFRQYLPGRSLSVDHPALAFEPPRIGRRPFRVVEVINQPSRAKNKEQDARSPHHEVRRLPVPLPMVMVAHGERADRKAGSALRSRW